MFPCDSILGKTTVWRPHLMEGSDTVAGFELSDVGADLFDYAGDIISGVVLSAEPLWDLPVLGIASTDNHFDQDLIRVRFRDRRIHDLDRWA